MSEKLQRTAAYMREKMLSRYDDGLHHKHDKFHLPYRLHCRTHPAHLFNPEDDTKKDVYCSTGRVRAKNLRKIRKRLDKGRIH